VDNAQLRLLAVEVANQLAFHNLGYWLALLALTIVGGACGRFLGSYFKKRGEQYATKADIGHILQQTEQITRITANTNSVVALGEWSERERRTIRRMKLEEVLMAAYRTRDWINVERDRFIWRADAPTTPSPMPVAIALGRLFLPELAKPLEAYDASVNAFLLLLHEVAGLMSRARRKTYDADSGEPGPQKAAAVIRNSRSDDISGAAKVVDAALHELVTAAARLMDEIIAAPPSKDQASAGSS
jgi:hypothetical protein